MSENHLSENHQSDNHAPDNQLPESRAVDPRRFARRTRDVWVTAALVAGIVAIFLTSLALAPRSDAPEGEAFPGTDAVVTDTLSQGGVEPWFEPIFEPGSSEVESGLFALQAALGAGVLGYALGNLRGRRAEREQPHTVDR
ncbi:energy-coupling factor ABC transporter substrate-binding protein [Luteococcus sp. Sow4_B9]|uniref:energy-coupling factor ABC transporter substrate-binding protein n=1 Tax=Luteococcus sp. Sow4_B9 TaxID=3438792 RepID=UPI003F9D0D12